MAATQNFQCCYCKHNLQSKSVLHTGVSLIEFNSASTGLSRELWSIGPDPGGHTKKYKDWMQKKYILSSCIWTKMLNPLPGTST